MGQISLTGQALALHNLGTNGIITRTGAGTVAGRTISSGTGVAVTNGDGVATSPSIALSGQALALHNLGTNGLITRTAAGTVAARTITASNGVSVSDGDGVAANPALSLSVPRPIIFVSDTINYLAAAATYTNIGTTPAGARFVMNDLIFTIDAITGAFNTGDTVPAYRVYNSNSATALANQMCGSVTPFSLASTPSAVNQYARPQTTVSRQSTTAASSTLYLRVETAYAIGTGNMTSLSGKAIVSGILYT